MQVPGVRLRRWLSILTLMLFAVGLLAGGAASARMVDHHGPVAHHEAGHHHAGHQQASADCDGVPCESDAPAKAHRHGAAGCFCMIGACDLTGLPAGQGEPFAYRLVALFSPREALPAALDHPPPLRPPRA